MENWITTISTLIMMIATVFLAIAAWQAKNSFLSEKKFDLIFELYEEITKAKSLVWDYMGKKGENVGEFLPAMKTSFEKSEAIYRKIMPFLKKETKDQLSKDIFRYSQLYLAIAQGMDKQKQSEIIMDILKIEDYTQTYDSIIKELKGK